MKRTEDLKSDPNNYNLGRTAGRKTLELSLERQKIGRGVVVAADGTIIAGNKTVEAINRAGGAKIKVVDTTGDKLVVVKRADISGREDEAFQELALYDNLAGAQSINWNAGALVEDFEPDEIRGISGQLAEKMLRLIPEDEFTTDGGEREAEHYDYPDGKEDVNLAMISLFLTTDTEGVYEDAVRDVIQENEAINNESDAVAYLLKNWTQWR